MLNLIRSFFRERLAPSTADSPAAAKQRLQLAVGALRLEMTRINGVIRPKQCVNVEAPVLGFHARGSRSWRAALPMLVAAAVMTAISGCAAPDRPDGASQSGEPRIVRQVDLQLRPGASDDGERVFRDASLRGTATASGAWSVRAEIVHPRLRCASYQLGLRFGSGDAACEDVDWRTGNDFLPSRTQCNNATLIHSGDGSIDLPPEELGALNCVRAIVRCTGACG